VGRYFLLSGAIAAFLAVAMGAFGAHGLRGILSDYSLSIYQTAVQYQLWHALGLCLVALLCMLPGSSGLLVWSGCLMIVGILVFSGSLYALAVSGNKFYGMVTPFGGMAFLFAWLLLGIHAWRIKRFRV
jgi:uncharacterized membrane protein YgdD (TMEM256/DUF423 family)